MKSFIHIIRRALTLIFIAGLFCIASCVSIQTSKFEIKSADPFFENFTPTKAPESKGLFLKTGDRLAICGDSITEQKRYSRLMETYLTVCVPQLKITTRQYGWSGETAEGFLRRMTNDCLRFKPTIATTCYGMNDYKYRPYDEANGQWYRERYTAVAQSFKNAGTRVILGSPGCVGKVASWVKTASGTLEEHNLSLCKLRNIDIEIAAKEHVRFADIFWPMFTAGYAAQRKYGPDYAVAGKDGVHPGWAGQLVMAYAYLKAMGLDGDIGTFTVDLKKNRAEATEGHKINDFKNGTLTITSSKYPFCATGETNQDSSLRSGMTLVPFNEQLNRLRLVVKYGTAAKYKVTWGEESRTYSTEQLATGINLAEDFAVNPFLEAFNKVDEAIAAKQAYETTQIKKIFHGTEGTTNMEAAVLKTENERAPLATAIQAAFVPVTHTIRIEVQ
jgi:lysophospholipase L1-like esterase